jgi:transcriptional regulator with XRE-family HTH domain
MTLSPAQCRAARALLDWQQLDLARYSKVSKQAIVQFERGRREARERTLDDLREAFERHGIEILDPIEGVRGAGVQMRAGFETITRAEGKAARGAAREDEGDISALDLSFVEVSDEDREPPAQLVWTEDDCRDQIAYWRAQPEKWTSLHDVSRQALLQAMGRRFLFADN